MDTPFPRDVATRSRWVELGQRHVELSGSIRTLDCYVSRQTIRYHPHHDADRNDLAFRLKRSGLNIRMLAEPSAKDDDRLSVTAIADAELDSTGAGSPPSTTLEELTLLEHGYEHASPAAESHNQAPDAGPTEPADAPHPARAAMASRSQLDSALGGVLVISGGSGYNDLVGATPGATYVMPISDNGGSSSEIIRVLGGPSIGDIRSRLNRLIPTPARHDSAAAPSNDAIHKLLAYRLPSHGSSREIKQEWMDILEGRHRLWRGIEPERKEVIRGFLVHFESEVLRRAHRHFNFRGGSIGNFFLAAAQKFFRSIQSAIFLFAATTQIDTSSFASKVLPVINTNHTATIAAELQDGDIIVGQCEISHPSPKASDRAASQMEKSGSLASQPPGTPSSAVFDARAAQTLLGDGGPLTPGFGPPAHYHVTEPFESNYTSMSGSVDMLRMGTSESEARPSAAAAARQYGASATPLRTGAGPSPLFAQLVDERAAAYAAQVRKGRTTVGNHKDGLDPEDDDQDSQDGNDPTDSPRDSSAAEDDPTDARHSVPELGWSHQQGGAKKLARSARREKTGNIIFSKSDDAAEPALASPIRRILYVNAYRNEIRPAPNPAFVGALGRCQTLIYSCGSLWTSIIPCLALRSIGTTIATSTKLRYKVLLLNTIHDRETRGMDALDFVSAICDSLNHSDQPELADTQAYTPNQFITHIVYFPAASIAVDTHRLNEMGITCIPAASTTSKNGTPIFDQDALTAALHHITRQT